jgi:predicted transcriptional regulator
MNALQVFAIVRKLSSMAKKDAQITVRISSDLKAKLEAQAKSEERSLAFIVERILREYFYKKDQI